jgi:hypothetical protein
LHHNRCLMYRLRLLQHCWFLRRLLSHFCHH